MCVCVSVRSLPFEIIDILRANGADITRTVICTSHCVFVFTCVLMSVCAAHLDRTIRDYPTLLRLAQTGTQTFFVFRSFFT